MKKRTNNFFLFSISIILLIGSQHLYAKDDKYVVRHPDRIKFAYEQGFRKDSDENIIALDLFLDIEKNISVNNYTAAVSIVDKIIKDYHYGKIGKQRLFHSVGTRVSRDYCYCYRNMVFDTAVLYKSILLCKLNNLVLAKNTLEEYLRNIEVSNTYSEDYKKDFLNDPEFIMKFAISWNNEDKDFAKELSQRKDLWFFWEVSQHRPDKIAFMMLIAIYRLQKDEDKAQKILVKFTKLFPRFEEKFKYKELMNLNELYLKNKIDSDYVFWNLYY